MEENLIISGYKKPQGKHIAEGIISLIISVVAFAISSNFGKFAFIAIIVGIFLFIGAIECFVLYSKYSKGEITVTSKRVTGITLSGQRIDLPLEQLLSAGSALNGNIILSTSSGQVEFTEMENSKQVIDRINELIGPNPRAAEQPVQPQIQPQMQQPVQPQPKTGTGQAPLSVADELIKFKELLDTGVITQQEFEDKKHQLLAQ